MVHAHGGDDRRLRHVDHIGGVQAAAQAHLQHHDVAAALPEIQHGHSGDQLKLCGMIRHGLRHRAHLFRQRPQVLRGDPFAVHLDPLPEILQEGRGAKPHPVSRRPEDRSEARADAALAVGPRHMDEPKLLLRIAQLPQQRPDALQSRRVGLPLEAVDIRYRVLTVHRRPPPFKPGARSPAAAANAPEESPP